jgi:hypothetical protein
MFENIGPSERKIRIAAGVALMGVGFAAPIPDLWHAVSITAGVALLMSSALGFCPFKAVVFMKTN